MVPLVAPGHAPLLYLGYASVTGPNLITLRTDLWAERWGLGVGLGLIERAATAGERGVRLDLPVLYELRRQHVSIRGFGLQLQGGPGLRYQEELDFELPVALGIFLNVPLPLALSSVGLEHVVMHPWLALESRYSTARSGILVGGSGGLRLLVDRGFLAEWGALLSYTHWWNDERALAFGITRVRFW